MIAPTVHAWLGQLPATYKPPSRSRTAPPALPSWFLQAGLPQHPPRGGAAAAGGGGAGGGAGGGGARAGGTLALPSGVRPPPLSAPAAQGNSGKSHGPRTFDMLALAQAVERGSSKLPAHAARNARPSNTLTLPSMPEEAPIDFSAKQWMAAPAPAPRPAGGAWGGAPAHAGAFKAAGAPAPAGGFGGGYGGGGYGGGGYGGGGGETFMTSSSGSGSGGGGGDDSLGAFMYAARMGNELSVTQRASRSMGGRHMR